MEQLYSKLTRTQKKLFFIIIDLIALPLALWSSFSLRFGELSPLERIMPFWWMFLVVPVAGVYIFARLGLYRAVVRFIGEQATTTIVKGVVALSLLLYALAYMTEAKGFPRSVPLNFAIIAGLYVSAVRFLVRAYYHRYVGLVSGQEPVLIYGAGSAGSQLSLSIASSSDFNVVGFLDDDDSITGHEVNGVTVYSPSSIDALISDYKVSRVLLAIPSVAKSRRRKIIELLKCYPVHVQTLPSVTDLVSEVASYEQVRDIELDDLLGREPVPPNSELLEYSVSDKVVMVTGAGGSIGAELCRQIISLHPRQLIMYDNGEYALYAIEKELQETLSRDSGNSSETVAILGSVCNRQRVDDVVRQYGVNTIYHAAAYKHVPMVEHNILEGVQNNLFGTKVVAEQALANSVERFILISTDKAVRPTNVMGATKRAAEQVIQNLAARCHSTIFSMVRFGNVLGSSGSVVPLFRRQIEEGGPVTVTHEEITRYFMTIPEAAQLVIQAGAMAKGGDVFVLDMGSPVKIIDLARNMIQLSGRKIKDENHPDGDIAIKLTGLRPGEKLYEELLIGINVSGTEHPRIMRANEGVLKDKVLKDLLRQMEEAVTECKPDLARDILVAMVSGYTPSPHIVDHLGLSSHDKHIDAKRLH